jgi:hypothetical protein
MSGNGDKSDSDDDLLRRALETAHGGETAPPFRAVLERRPRRRAMLLMPLAFAGAVAAALVLWPHAAPPPPPPIALSSLQLSSRGPLDFLLTMPGDALLAQTPRFDAKGDWP